MFLCRSCRTPRPTWPAWPSWPPWTIRTLHQRFTTAICLLRPPGRVQPLLRENPPFPSGHLQRAEPLQHSDGPLYVHHPGRLPVQLLLPSLQRLRCRGPVAQQRAGAARFQGFSGRSPDHIRRHGALPGGRRQSVVGGQQWHHRPEHHKLLLRTPALRCLKQKPLHRADPSSPNIPVISLL